jgi:probable rRNA maturation factor
VDPDSRRLRVTVSDGRGRPVRDGGLARWLASVAPARARGDVAIAFVSDARSRELNRRYRRRDRPTDVLAFPNSEPRAELGDIVIATGVARRQAREQGHTWAQELRVLALHGLLHLLGYDHHDKDDGGRMARLESRLRRKGGLTSGLIERERPQPERGAKPPSESERGWGPASSKKRLRPERGAKPPSESERGWGPASSKKRPRPERGAKPPSESERGWGPASSTER